MIVRKMLFASVISLCLLSAQAVAKEEARAGVSGSKVQETDEGGGIVNRIDFAMNQIVISNVVYGYSSGRLVVRKEGKRAPGATSLQPNQVVHFNLAPRKPGSDISAVRTITEIWIDEK